jgi:hypothetical protein
LYLKAFYFLWDGDFLVKIISPNLQPIIKFLICRLIKNFPLCTRKCRPTQLGVIVTDLGVLLLLIKLFSTVFLQEFNADKLFHFERDIICYKQIERGVVIMILFIYYLLRARPTLHEILAFCV